MSELRKTLDKLSNNEAGKASENFNYRRSNKEWLKKSNAIALQILVCLRQRGISQKDLAEQLMVSPQQISKIVKGKENLTLDTITAIEKALGITLIDIHHSEKEVA